LRVLAINSWETSEKSTCVHARRMLSTKILKRLSGTALIAQKGQEVKRTFCLIKIFCWRIILFSWRLWVFSGKYYDLVAISNFA
jgi:hypothetical protein